MHRVGVRAVISPRRFWTLVRRPDSFELADLILSWTGEESSPRRISVGKESSPVLRTLMATTHNFGTTILRLVLGFVFFARGLDKMAGWFGGYGSFGTMSSPLRPWHGPTAIATIAMAAEFFGGLSLIVGFLTRVVATGSAVNVAVAILMVDSSDGFFRHWSGAQNGAWFEFHFLVLAIAFFLIIQGAGAASVDRVLFPTTCESYRQILDKTKVVAIGKIRVIRRL